MDILEILQALNNGTAMLCCKGRKEPFKKLFCLKLETMDIQQLPITSSQSKKPPQPEEYGMSYWGNVYMHVLYHLFSLQLVYGRLKRFVVAASHVNSTEVRRK